MFGCRLQILPDRKEVDVGCTHIVHDLQHRLSILTQPNHDTGLGEHRRVQFLDALKQPQGVEIPRAGTHLGVKAGDGFQIMIEHVRFRRNDNFQSRWIAFDEIGRQDFDRRIGGPLADRADRLSKMLRTAIVHVVPVDRRDDDVVQPQFLHRIRNAPRLEHVQRFGRLAGCDVAERAGTGADLAHDHHGRMALRPAFPDIGTTRLLADRHQFMLAHDLSCLPVTFANGRLDANPGRFLRLRIIRPPGLFGVTFGGDLQVAHPRSPRVVPSSLKASRPRVPVSATTEPQSCARCMFLQTFFPNPARNMPKIHVPMPP